MKENFGEDNITPEDKKKMEDLLNEAKIIINNGSKNTKEPIPHNKLSPEQEKEAMADLEKVKEQLLDDKNDFLTNTEKGTENEIFFRTLIKEIPELGLSINEKATGGRGIPLPDFIAIKTIPFKTDRQFISDLFENLTIDLFTNSANSIEEKENIGLELEGSGLLPKGTTSRFLSRNYKYDIERHPDLKEFFEKKYAKFKNTKPLSDKEIEEFMRKAIMEECRKKL